MLLVTAACGGSATGSGGSSSGGSSSGGSGGSGAVDNTCSDMNICCTFACDVNACQEPDAAPASTCFCDGDYQSGQDCQSRAWDLYRCMRAHMDGYVCVASKGSEFRCDAFCQKENAAATTACGRHLVQCAP